MSFDVKRIESCIDHTYLKPDATSRTIAALCAEARTHRFHSVCVNGAWVPLCAGALQGSGVAVAAVVGFPLGAAKTAVKAFEAETAARDGAAEIDMVLPVGKLLEGAYGDVRADIRAVVEAVRGQAIVKVILETGLLSDDRIKTACALSEEAGAHFVKTSTGFGPGGATVRHVELMRASVSPAVGVKASGGVRDYDTAVKLIAAGANRIGTSSGVAIAAGAADGSGARVSAPADGGAPGGSY